MVVSAARTRHSRSPKCSRSSRTGVRLSLINRREEQACLPRLLLRALSRLIEQHRRELCRGHLGARSRASGLAPPTAGGQLTILDYRAPAGFGPPRHLHHREDEVIELIEGQAVVWTPNLSFVLAPGDLVLLPN